MDNFKYNDIFGFTPNFSLPQTTSSLIFLFDFAFGLQLHFITFL